MINYRSRRTQQNTDNRIWGLGFTLVELLIVITTIGILASALIFIINPVQQFAQANDAKRKTDLRQIQLALETYRTDQGVYPLDASFSTCGVPFAFGATTYMQSIPCDPKGTTTAFYNGGVYYYKNTSSSTYDLVACLQDTKPNTSDTNVTQSLPGGAPGCPSGYSWYYVLHNP